MTHRCILLFDLKNSTAGCHTSFMGIRDLDLTLTFEPLYESQSYFFYLYTDDRPYDAFSTSQRIIVSYWYLCLYSEIQHFYQNSQRQYVIWVFNSISSFNTVHHFPSSFLALSWQQRETQQMVTCVKFTSDATLLEYLITYGLHAVLSFTLFIWSVCLCCFCFFTFHQVVPLIFKENVT